MQSSSLQFWCLNLLEELMLGILRRRKKNMYFKCGMQKAPLKTRKKSVNYQLFTSHSKPPLESDRTSEKINSFMHREANHIHRVLQFCQSFPYFKLSMKSTKPQVTKNEVHQVQHKCFFDLWLNLIWLNLRTLITSDQTT